MQNEGRISKEEINSAWRSERKSKSIQPLRKDFYQSVENLLKDLNTRYSSLDPRMVSRLDDTPDIARGVVRERLRKIASQAVMGAYGQATSIDLYTNEEREFYESVKDVCRRFIEEFDRGCGLGPVTDEAAPVTEREPEKAPRPEPREEEAEAAAPREEAADPPADVFDADMGDPFPDDPDLFETEEEVPPLPDDGNSVVVRALEDIPTFTDVDGREITLKKGTVGSISKMYAYNLVEAHLAAIVEPRS